MSEGRGERSRRLDPDDVALIEEMQSPQGEEMPADQDAVLEPDEFESRRTPTQTELDRGEPSPDVEAAEGEVATLDGLATDSLREGETDDPDVATEEGLTYVPPKGSSTRPSLPTADQIGQPIARLASRQPQARFPHSRAGWAPGCHPQLRSPYSRACSTAQNARIGPRSNGS